MTSKIFKLVAVLAVVGILVLPEIVMTQGPGVMGRVYNRRLRRVYPNLGNAATPGSAFADPALAPGDILLIAGNINEPATGIIIPPGWFGTIVSETRTGFVATIRVTGGLCPPPSGLVVDTSLRGGLVQWIGGNIVVPGVFCIAFEADGMMAGGGNPLTINNVRITAGGAGPIGGIDLFNEFGGPFNFQGNVMPNLIAGGFGMGVDGDGATAITATVRNNRIGSVGGIVSFGIGVFDVPTGSTVVVERNVVDGDNDPAGVFGIDVEVSLNVIVRRNTARNFSGSPGSVGIFLSNADGTQVLANRVQNNTFGIVVDGIGGDDSFDAVTPLPLTIGGTAANGNNITGTAPQVGVFFCDGDCTGAAPNGNTLNATNNFWGAASGPADTQPGSFCGGTACGTASGTGVPVSAPGGAGDCGAGASQITTCPRRTLANIAAGA